MYVHKVCGIEKRFRFYPACGGAEREHCRVQLHGTSSLLFASDDDDDDMTILFACVFFLFLLLLLHSFLLLNKDVMEFIYIKLYLWPYIFLPYLHDSK